MTGFIILSVPRKKEAVMLALFNALVGIWCLFQLFGELASDRAMVLLFTKVNLSAAVAIPVAFLGFVLAFTKSGKFSRVWTITGYGISFGLILSLTGTLFISGLEKTEYFKFYPSAGPLYFVFAAYFFIYVFAGFYDLIKTFKISSGSKRNQTVYIIAASFIGFACGSTQFFPVFGINVFPVGMFIFPLYAVLAAYAVVFHRLLDIKVAIRKSLIYSIIVIIFSAFYALMLLLFMGLIQKITGLNYFVSAAATIAVFALLFDPLKNYVQKTVDRLFFRDSYDVHKALQEFSKAAVSIINIDELLDAAVKELCSGWKIKDVVIALKDRCDNIICIKRRVGFEKIEGDILLPLDMFEKGAPIIADESPTDRASRMLLEKNISLVVPIKEKNDITGFVALGEKPLRGMWNGQDLEILAVICGQIGFAVEKERLYQENFDAQRKLIQGEKFAAIGSISASMAHEIKNPLTALKGMVSVLAENASDHEFMSKFSEISIRQLDRINSTVENLLRLSRRSEGGIAEPDTDQIVELAEVLKEITALISAKCKEAGIEIKDKITSAPIVKANRKEILHAFLNIIMNSIEAMSGGGELELFSDHRQIVVVDTGQGMDSVALSRMFDPFYTTKERGAGIGLSITEEIISRSGGKIEVESVQGKGTRFSIKFS